MTFRGGLAEGGQTEPVSGSWGRQAPGHGAMSMPDECADSLRRTIEAEIIPRLMMAHRPPVNDARAADVLACRADGGDVEVLTQLLLHDDAAQAMAWVRRRRSEGLPAEALYMDVLAPVARRLGAMWETDLVDFTQVTVGLWRLQQVIFDSESGLADGRLGATGRRVLLAAAPGSQHTFGVLMVGEFFRRAGWDVRGETSSDAVDLARAVGSDWFDVVGLSIGGDGQVDTVASAILGIRTASLNPAVVVLVGGPVAAGLADLVEKIGADGSAADAASAVRLAETLVTPRAGPA